MTKQSNGVGQLTLSGLPISDGWSLDKTQVDNSINAALHGMPSAFQLNRSEISFNYDEQLYRQSMPTELQQAWDTMLQEETQLPVNPPIDTRTIQQKITDLQNQGHNVVDLGNNRYEITYNMNSSSFIKTTLNVVTLDTEQASVYENGIKVSDMSIITENGAKYMLSIIYTPDRTPVTLKTLLQ
jgi:hypothetical protein